MKEKLFDIICNGQFVLRTTEFLLGYFLKAYIDGYNFDEKTTIEIIEVKDIDKA